MLPLFCVFSPDLMDFSIHFSSRTSILQREIDNLRRELDTANQRTSDCDRAARNAQVYHDQKLVL